MIIETIRMFFAHRRRTVPSVSEADLPDSFRGVPRLDSGSMDADERGKVAAVCPLHAINAADFSLDMGKCLFCGECARMYPENITFTNDWRIWGFSRDDLVVSDGQQWKAPACPATKLKYKDTLRMRHVCAGGDMGCELELDACSDVNFDMQRFGMEFTASPRHADAMVLTGPITSNMASAVKETWDAIPDPKLLIAVGTEAVSGGLFADGENVDRAFLDEHAPDLYIPGSPVHPLTFISAVAALTGRIV